MVHALRLVKKALSVGSRVLVLADEAAVRELDGHLWTAEPDTFLAHAIWQAPSAQSSVVRHAPVWLMAVSDTTVALGAEVPTEPEVLINLGVPVPANAQRFSKVIEVVGTRPDARSQGQQRWRCWKDWRVAPGHHAFS